METIKPAITHALLRRKVRKELNKEFIRNMGLLQSGIVSLESASGKSDDEVDTAMKGVGWFCLPNLGSPTFAAYYESHRLLLEEINPGGELKLFNGNFRDLEQHFGECNDLESTIRALRYPMFFGNSYWKAAGIKSKMKMERFDERFEIAKHWFRRIEKDRAIEESSIDAEE
jgi:hypothetical protein